MLHAMVALFAGQLMGAKADAWYGAEHDQAGERRAKLKYRNEVPPDAEHVEAAREDLLAFTAYPREVQLYMPKTHPRR